MVGFLSFNFSRERNFCFGAGGSVPAPQAPPAPQPTPTATNVNPIASASDRASTLKKLQFGLASTVLGGKPGGMTGSGANLTAPAAVGQATTTLGGAA